MIGLGIEGTAHTYGVGVVRQDGPDGDVEVLANVRSMHRPDEGGIHPREAADHHAEAAPGVLREALEVAGVARDEVDLVAFSRGPGLGPSLRATATGARALSMALEVPLVDVNHCVAHQEIGRAVTPAEDPVLLYASGANTQVIAYTAGRYRVIGETLDVGIGNMLDKFARAQGLPFPGGPVLEERAAEADAAAQLPYSVKGMDVAFSGILNAALHLADDGVPLEEVAHGLQETTFAMLAEVTERALAHAGKDEVVLGGGVACNDRLRGMVRTMAEARDATAYAPDPGLCVDNGAMIAWTGMLAHRAGRTAAVEASGIDQRWRTDDVDVVWRDGEAAGRPDRGAPAPGRLAHGAEAVVEATERMGRDAVAKRRLPKAYRHPALDRRLRVHRATLEARLLREARAAGVRTPLVLEVDRENGTLVLERLPGPTVRDALDAADPPESAGLLRAMGATVARLHAAGLVHGDLTTSNAMVLDGDEPAARGDAPAVALIDLGLGDRSEQAAGAEEQGTDLHVLLEALEATHADHPDGVHHVLAGYRDAGGREAVEAKLEEIRRRGRYRAHRP